MSQMSVTQDMKKVEDDLIVRKNVERGILKFKLKCKDV
jgi:hypothetical protein